MALLNLLIFPHAKWFAHITRNVDHLFCELDSRRTLHPSRLRVAFAAHSAATGAATTLLSSVVFSPSSPIRGFSDNQIAIVFHIRWARFSATAPIAAHRPLLAARSFLLLAAFYPLPFLAPVGSAIATDTPKISDISAVLCAARSVSWQFYCPRNCLHLFLHLLAAC